MMALTEELIQQTALEIFYIQPGDGWLQWCKPDRGGILVFDDHCVYAAEIRGITPEVLRELVINGFLEEGDGLCFRMTCEGRRLMREAIADNHRQNQLSPEVA
ncbi:MAG TPA: hypothetical protein VLE72_02340 [Candidatus Saccharimonadales bacterium]|nr:hypothetical protein [Candidatus Saccharimonadales bacterium]